MSIKQTFIAHLTRPYTMVDFHFWALVIWLLLGYPAIFIWGKFVVWVSIMSWYAIVSTHLGGLSAARAEVAAVEDSAG